MKDRQRGCLFGLAIGDALGAAVEFKMPGSFPLVTTYRGNGPHRLNPGEWTDDTSMALALADSLALMHGFDLNDQAQRYLEWKTTGKYSVNKRCFDIGRQTSQALNNFSMYKNASLSGSQNDANSGNGSIMRLAPVPIKYAFMFPKQIKMLSLLCEQSSIPTHASESCLSACRYLGVVLAALMNGVEREEVLSMTWTVKQMRALHPAIQDVADGSYKRKNPPQIQGTGWVVKSLEAALWAFYGASTFEEAVLRAVNLGQDADTTGAICGQLAGAYWGESAIPKSLMSGLARKDMIETALAGIV